MLTQIWIKPLRRSREKTILYFNLYIFVFLTALPCGDWQCVVRKPVWPNLNTHFYSVVFDLFCIFRENAHEQQLIQAKILYQCPSRNILDFLYDGSHFSTGVIFLRVRHVKKLTPVTFFLHMRHVFLRPGVISLRRKMTPRSIFDGGRYYLAPILSEKKFPAQT